MKERKEEFKERQKKGRKERKEIGRKKDGRKKRKKRREIRIHLQSKDVTFSFLKNLRDTICQVRIGIGIEIGTPPEMVLRGPITPGAVTSEGVNLDIWYTVIGRHFAKVKINHNF